MPILGVSGHRPKYWGYSQESHDRLKALVSGFIAEGKPTKVLTGMAIGMDMAVAEVCMELGIPYIAAVPFRGQDSQWPPEAQEKYRYLLAGAQAEIVVSDTYSDEAFKKRNAYIVANCHSMLVLYNGATRSGTGHTVGLAIRRGLQITNLWDDFLSANPHIKGKPAS